MTFSLELILVLGTLVTGLIWLGWAVLRRLGSVDRRRSMPWYVDYSRSFFPVLLIVLVLRSFVAEPFRIPSGSMMPTLLVGDFILVNKFSYGVRLPVTRSVILDSGKPERGDVAVFKYPRNPAEDYIKRVIGVPGDVIEFRDRTLYVNGEPQETERLGTYTGVGSGSMMTGALRYREHLGDTPHEILMWEGSPGLSGSVRVPEGHYFMVGDNRDNSNDSRMWGFVSEDLLVGRALFIWLNWDYNGGHWDFSRIGNRIR
ncbi:Signal peptidase I [Thioalkalivibrio nitratireducens DSM 14787]|uniref:Signal peptidase I n=1 Tax=Thioalkalivibrio nitratireducens (strain DSM 14787 / UNIQEM 213 / ALEN2) TaxID=1255043 RepID=L0DVZ7_THIND|nr:signal peptidase I [Thioalkalivibrio nitratireducens]AGA32516.1 Signal peptidase I [Thioalkalivibrio nitratireducens DSM 14787]